MTAKSWLPSPILAESIDALAVRARWYETRNYRVPDAIISALRYLCDMRGVDASAVDGRAGKK